jgi:S-adenosylmethionine decarboxylase
MLGRQGEMEKFEGPEKKLEIILSTPQTGLRDNFDGRWERVVRSSGAEILNGISSERLDAYLLSESSLFVWDDRVVMITCGQTTPVMALPEMLSFIDRDKIAFLFYERKRLNFPEEQFTNFEFDRRFLERLMPGVSTRVGSTDQDHIHVFYHGNGHRAPDRDSTLRILMHDIDPVISRRFVARNNATPPKQETLADLSCIDDSMALDQYFFHPQGYSLNGVSGGHYLTVHVTPEPDASYTSVETNCHDLDFRRVVEEVIRRFNPGRFGLFLRTCRRNDCPELHGKLPLRLDGFQTIETTHRIFDRHYMASWVNFRRKDVFT